MSGRITKINDNNTVGSLPIVGKLKVGEIGKSAGGKDIPRSLDYFKADGKYAELFHQKLGKNPKKIAVAFLTDNISSVCNERFESWDNGSMRGFKFGYGDGDTFYIYDPAKSKYIEWAKGDDGFEEEMKKYKWQAILTLRFVVLELRGVMGQWQLTTRGAKSSIPGIVDSFDFVKNKAGTIIGLPFDLIVSKNSGRNLNKEGTKIQSTSYPIIGLVPNFTEENIQSVRDYVAAGGNPAEMGILTMDMKKLNTAPETKAIEAPNQTPDE